MKPLRDFFSHKKWLLAVGILVAAAVICCAVAASRFLWVGGQLVSRQVSSLDLRGEELALSDYAELQRKLPKCDILWNVPIGDSWYPSDSETLPVQGMTEQDLSLIHI